MKEINMTCKQFTKMFTVKVDQERRWVCSVGTDGDDNLSYNTSEEYHIGNAYATVERFYIIDITEFDLLIDVALADKHISQDYAVNQKKAVHIKYKDRTIDEEMTLPADVSRFKTILYQDEVYTLGILARPVFENHISECIVYRGREYYLGSDPGKLTTFVFTKIKNYSRRIGNAFYVKGVFEAFQAGKQVRAVTGVLYDPKKFCRLIAHIIDDKRSIELWRLEDACGIRLPDVIDIEQLAQNIAERVINRETVMYTYRMKEELDNAPCQTAEDVSLRNAEMAYLPKIEMKNNGCRSIDNYQEWVSLELKIPYDSKNTYRLSLGLSHDKIIVVAVVYENSDKYYYRNNVTIAGCDVIKLGCEVSKSTYTDNLVLYAVRCSAVLPLPAGQEYHKNDDLEGMFSTLQTLLQLQIKAERVKERERISRETSVIWAEITDERYKQEEMARIAKIKAEKHATEVKNEDRCAAEEEETESVRRIFMQTEGVRFIRREDYEAWFTLGVNCLVDCARLQHERGSLGVDKAMNKLFFVFRSSYDLNNHDGTISGHDVDLEDFKQAVRYAERHGFISSEASAEIIKKSLKSHFASNAQKNGTQVKILSSSSNGHVTTIKSEQRTSKDTASVVSNKHESICRQLVNMHSDTKFSSMKYETWFSFECIMPENHMKFHGSVGFNQTDSQFYLMNRDKTSVKDDKRILYGDVISFEAFKELLFYAESKSFVSRKKTNKFLNDAIRIENERNRNEKIIRGSKNNKTKALEEKSLQKTEFQDAMDHLKTGGKLLFSSLVKAASSFLFSKK